MVFQKPNPFPMSIYDNIAYGPRTHGIRSKAKLDEIVEKSLRDAAIWDEVKDRLKKSALGMSGGQQQRLCIARALAVEPKVLICDEATSSLDVTIQKQIMELLEELKDTHGLSFIFICHNLALVQSFCDKVLVLYDGKVVESGKPDAIINEPKEAYTKKLVDAVFE